MPKVTYSATTRGGNFEPLKPPDNSEQILKQGERYIEGLKALRNAESARDAQFLRDFEATTNKGQQWKSDVDRERMRQARAAADDKIAQLKQQQQAAQAITGRKSSIQGIDSKTDKWVNFVTGLSETAGQMLGDYYTEQEAIWKKEGIAKAMLFPMNTDRLGFDRQFADLQIAGANQDTLAAYMEARGADPSEVHWMRTSNEAQLSAYKHALAKRHGQTLGQQFLLDLQTNDQFKINIKQQDGSTQSIPINQIDQNNPAQMSAAWMQYVPESFKNAGFGDANTEFITAGLEAAQGWYTEWSSKKMQQRISQATAQRLDQARTEFGINKDAKSWQSLYQTIFNNHPQAKGDPFKARAEAFKPLESASISDNEVAAIGRSSFYGQDKPISEQYSLEWQAMLEARKGNAIRAESNRVTLQSQQYNKLIEDLKAKANADLAPDGDIDIANEELEQLIKQYQNLPGAEGVVRQLQSMQKYTEDKIRDKTFTDQWNAAIARGEPPTVEEVMKAEVSDKVKADYVNKAKKEGAMAVPKELGDAAKNEIKQEIEQRVGWNINTNKARDPKIDRAINYALQQYKADYRAARLDDKTDAQAHDYALGRFKEALGTDKYKGTYAVGNTPDNMGGLVGFGRDAVTEVLNNPAVEIKKKLKELGPSAIDTPIIPKAQIEAAIKNIEKTGMYDIPPQIRIIQNNTNLSAIEIMQRQINAHGLQYELPQYAVEFDTETQNKFSEYKDLLNKYNNTTRTDIAMVGGGEDPIYSQLLPPDVASDVEFQKGVHGIAQRLGVKASDLFAIMAFESDNTFSPSIPNKAGSGAVGLIQFMPSTAAGLGTSTEQLASMTRVQQLEFVEKYLKNTGIQPGASLGDLYMSVLFPAAIGKDDNFVLFGNGAISGYTGRAYTQNSGLDRNKDGSITKGEAVAKAFGSSNPWRQFRNMNPAVVSKAKAQVGGLAPLDLAALGTTTEPID